MAEEIKKEYNNLSKKFKLPKFDKIDNEFEISTLDSPKFLIRNTLRRVSEKLEFYIDVIGSLIHPDGSSIPNMNEIKYFSEDDKNKMSITFKKLMKINRTIMALLLVNDDKESAEFLAGFFTEWMEIKNNLVSYVTKMKESWEKDTTMEEELGYFG